MDYISFNLKSQSSIDGIEIAFGSGLNSQYPGVCPLQRSNLRNSLQGDDCKDLSLVEEDN
jgi:hypothetical protein